MINSVGNAGDANGDGHPDFVVMTSTGDGGTPQAFVLFGGQGGDVKLDSLGDRGFVIDGAIRVAPAGDVNGDQRQDLAVVGPWDPLGLASSVYVVYGQDSPAKVDLSQLGTQGREIQLPMSNETSVGAGVQDIRAAGDVNNDGTDDVVVGDPAASSGAGRVWVVFGSDTATAPVSLDSIGSDGFEIRGDSGPGFGGSVSQAGDVNGDSIDDLIIGSPNHHDGIAQLGSGVAWVLYGSDSPTDVDLSKQLPADKGFRISTTEATAQVGDVVAGIGDVNQDQLADFLVTAPRSSPNGRNGAGAAYVIFGSRDGSEVVLDQLGSRGYAIQGPTRARKPNDRFPGGLGSSAASAGDVNGDGVPDVVLGSPGIRAPGAIAYVVFGDGGTGTVDLADPGGRALAIGSDTTLPSGATPVAGDADFDGDGQPDVLIGPVDGASGSSKAYVVSGTR
jgi:hypothetical protein